MFALWRRRTGSGTRGRSRSAAGGRRRGPHRVLEETGDPRSRYEVAGACR